MCLFFVFFFKQKTAYEMRISDWSSDVCSSDLPLAEAVDGDGLSLAEMVADGHDVHAAVADDQANRHLHAAIESLPPLQRTLLTLYHLEELRSEEHTSELQSLMRISYAVFCLKKKNLNNSLQ